MQHMNILITGSNGQLGSEIRIASQKYSQSNYFFTDVAELDICNKDSLETFIVENKIDALLNCAAYTAVDKSEDEVALCFKINLDAVQNMANIAVKYGLKLIHVSTDYVFDGTSYFPLTEDAPTAALGVYGQSKLAGEKALMQTYPAGIVIRTSWLYSSFGNNFVKTMIKLGREHNALRVVFDQVGTPTYAADLATTMLYIVHADDFIPGIYHYSNEGVCSWYDFAVKIHELANINCQVEPIQSSEYPTRTRRPHYSVLNKTKIKLNYGIQIPHWETSLRCCIEKLK